PKTLPLASRNSPCSDQTSLAPLPRAPSYRCRPLCTTDFPSALRCIPPALPQPPESSGTSPRLPKNIPPQTLPVHSCPSPFLDSNLSKTPNSISLHLRALCVSALRLFHFRFSIFYFLFRSSHGAAAAHSRSPTL